MADGDQNFVRELINRNRYLSLSTTDGVNPWIAPLEYVADDSLNLYFFSPGSTVHVQHLTKRGNVAVAIFDALQPEYEPAPIIRIAGIQLAATAHKFTGPYPPVVEKQIEAWQLPMPPYAVYKIVPERWYLPVIEDGINARLEVKMS